MSNKIFVGNVSFKCTQDDFRKCFSLMDGYLDSTLVTRYNSVLSKGYGTITFDTEENAHKMLDKHISLLDRELRFSIFEDKPKGNKDRNNGGDHEKTYKIYVAFPSNDMDEESLKEVFTQFGTINVFYTKTDTMGRKYSIIGFTEQDPVNNILDSQIVYDGKDVLVRPFKRRNRFNNKRSHK